MNLLDFLRQFSVGGYAIFDLIIAFVGMYLFSPFLSKLFSKIGIYIPKYNWVFLTLPIAILSHILVGEITPMTANFLNIYNYYPLKILIVILLFIGLRGIKILK